MVLNRSLALSLALLAACITTRPVSRAPQPTAIAALVIVDSNETRETSAPPKPVTDRLAEALSARNLLPEAPPATTTAAFASRRTTTARLQELASAATAPLVMLVETKAAFYSLLNGRFRWSVHARLSIARREALAEAITRDVDFPVFLDFDFQREPEALAAASKALADEAGRVADELLGGASPKSPQAIGPSDAIYFVMVDRFRNGDRSNDGDVNPADPQAFHGGDLQGVIEGLDGLQSQGVTTVWLSPVFAMRTKKFEGHGAFHGYWVEDFSRVEPRFGDQALLARLSDELHRRGMKLVLDVVLNHVANDAPLAAQHPEWFHHRGPIQDWNDREQLENGDVHGLPDLAQENDAVFRFLVDQSIRWIDAVRPDGFRLDAVKHVPLAFWARYNDAIRAHAGAGFMLLGEDLDGDPARLERTRREGHFTALFNFPLYFATIDVFCKGAHPGRLAAVLEAEGARAGPIPYVNLVDNHDLSRVATACGGDLAKARNALAFMLAAPGTPSITWGTEHALTGATEPENRRDLPDGPGPFTQAIRDGLSARSSAPGPLSFPSLDDTSVTIALDGRSLRIAHGGLTWAPALATTPAGKRDATHVSVVNLPSHLSAPRLVGLGRALGGWRYDSGIVLEQRGSKWEGDAPLASGGVYQFKLVAKSGDGRDAWESGDDRLLLVSGASVELAWRG